MCRRHFGRDSPCAPMRTPAPAAITIPRTSPHSLWQQTHFFGREPRLGLSRIVAMGFVRAIDAPCVKKSGTNCFSVDRIVVDGRTCPVLGQTTLPHAACICKCTAQRLPCPNVHLTNTDVKHGHHGSNSGVERQQCYLVTIPVRHSLAGPTNLCNPSFQRHWRATCSRTLPNGKEHLKCNNAVLAGTQGLRLTLKAINRVLA
jgi:hypothetical protein